MQRPLGPLHDMAEHMSVGVRTALTRDAVRELAGTLAVDAAAMHWVSGGNPFFATELLALGDAAGVPPTAVLARADGLPAPALEDRKFRG